MAYNSKGKILEAKKYYEKTISILKNRSDGKSYLATAYNNLASLYHNECKKDIPL